MAEPYASDLLQDHHLVVTGGGTGLGKAMAERFAALGAAVTVGGRRAEPLQETVEAIRGRGQVAGWETLNVRESDSVAAFFEAAEERNGPVTGLVNNAAANFLAASHTLSDNGFDAIVRTNLYGAFYCTRWCGERWIERETPGAVLSITTTYAETGSAFVLPSAVSKAGIVAMTKSLAVEWGTYGIRLNCLAPGPFPTKGAWERLVPDPQIAEHMKTRVPLKRFGEPEELADVAAFLLSDLARYLTGVVVPLDGGEVLASGGQFNDFAKQDREGVLALFEMMRKG
ncbi:MAG: SDR family oxidoreductase [Rubricoccaceae bacterium]|nr:SDR family oxidoreductase [Rubricoccaceae bacterium]